jgi:hypothetical protein
MANLWVTGVGVGPSLLSRAKVADPYKQATLSEIANLNHEGGPMNNGLLLTAYSNNNLTAHRMHCIQFDLKGALRVLKR